MRNWTLAALVFGATFAQVNGQTTYAPGVTQDALNSAAQQNLATMAATTPQFVGGSSAYMTMAQLFANYPASSTVVGQLAHVSDAWGSVSTTLVCEGSAGTYYWRPQRTDYAAAITQASGAITLTPLLNAPIIYLASPPSGTVNVTLSNTNVWPGAQFHIYAPATIGVGSVININGLVGGGTVPLVQGADKIITYVSGQGWKSN